MLTAEKLKKVHFLIQWNEHNNKAKGFNFSNFFKFYKF